MTKTKQNMTAADAFQKCKDDLAKLQRAHAYSKREVNKNGCFASMIAQKAIILKEDEALDACAALETVLRMARTGNWIDGWEIYLKQHLDEFYHNDKENRHA